MDKQKGVPKNIPLTVGFAQQVKANVIYAKIRLSGATSQRSSSSRLQPSWKPSLPDLSFTTHLLLQRGFLSNRAPAFSPYSPTVYSVLSVSEVNESLGGRPIILKNKSFALVHPVAFCIAQIAGDMPVIRFQVSIFPIILDGAVPGQSCIDGDACLASLS